MEEIRTISSYSVEELEEILDTLICDKDMLSDYADELELSWMEAEIRRVQEEIASRG